MPAAQHAGAPERLLARLSEADEATLLSCCTERHFSRDAPIFSQGRRHTTFLIKSGVVRTFYVSASGKEITLAYWSRGDLIGGPYFFDDARANIWSAHAVEESVLLAIDGPSLRDLAERIPALALLLIDALSFKLNWVSLVLQALGTEFVHGRLAMLIVHLSELYGEPCDGAIRIRYEFTQADLAAMVGMTRQWVSTALGQLQHAGIVRVHKRRLYILDPAALKARASNPPSGV
jgi:CRP-like cAMP-binding protein